MKKISTLIVFILCFHRSLVFADDPKGWTVLKQTIENTLFSDVTNLLNRTFDLEVEGATKDYEFTVQPESVFKVERLQVNKFRVTIIKPEALINRDLIVEYYPIGWNLKRLDHFKPVITGEANCLYNVVFSQSGGGELDLSKFDVDYDVTYELSNPESVSSVKRAGKGYDIVRTVKTFTESKIRLKIKKKVGDFNLQTDWILIPVCNGKSTPISVVANPPTTVYVTDENPKDMLELKIDGISFCEESTGLFCSTLQIKATNKSQKRLRCNTVWFYMKYEGQIVIRESQWIELDGGQKYNFQVVLKAPYKPANKWTYEINKTECAFK